MYPASTKSKGLLETGYVSESARRVLKNTYSLLALSLLPTVGGAYAGLQIPMLGGLFSGFVGALVFLGIAFGLMFVIEKNKHNASGVGWLLLFTFVMGVALSRMLGAVLSLSNGATIVMQAFAGTAFVFAAMSALAHTIKKDLSFMGKFLFVGVLMLIVAGLLNMFFASGALSITLSVLSMGIFSMFLLMETQQIVRGGETNYISATLSIYLSLYNIFQSLLHLLGVFGGED